MNTKFTNKCLKEKITVKHCSHFTRNDKGKTVCLNGLFAWIYVGAFPHQAALVYLRRARAATYLYLHNLASS